MISEKYFFKEYQYLETINKNIEKIKQVFQIDELKFLDDLFWNYLILLIKSVNPNIDEKKDDMLLEIICDFINSESEFIDYNVIYENENNPFVGPERTERIYKNKLYEYISKGAFDNAE